VLLAHGARHLGLLVRAPGADRVGLGEPRAQLAVVPFQVLDAYRERGALLCRRLAIVTPVVAAELVDHVDSKQGHEHRGDQQRRAQRRGALPHHERCTVLAEH